MFFHSNHTKKDHLIESELIWVISFLFTFLRFFPSCQSSTKFSQERVILLSGGRRLGRRRFRRRRRFLRRRRHVWWLNPGQLAENCPDWRQLWGKKEEKSIGVHSLKRKRNSRHFSRGEAPPPGRKVGDGREKRQQSRGGRERGKHAAREAGRRREEEGQKLLVCRFWSDTNSFLKRVEIM